MKVKRIITPVSSLLAAIIAGGLGIGYELGMPVISAGFIVIFILMAAWGTSWMSASKK
ncbi:hypothetical protein ACFOLK_07285 [Marinococcus halophilus]|uniref:Uncharacterized protein n=1 Tax=Marinococcus halophilus TaxID=1371 RepID=A0A510Y8Z9_MARHA|nr:hypothetical protein [Marinococcus halophilus]GEK59856.1 hypothetical protein MHA01_27610 [Marinococcus halophilus]